MGISESLAEDYNIVSTFNQFIDHIRSTKKNLLTTSNKLLDQLAEQAKSFFAQYQILGERNKDIISETINLDSYFEHIIFALDGFKICSDVITTNKKISRNDKSTITIYFRDYFPKFISQLIQLAKMATNLLGEIMNNPLKEPMFYLELNIFDFALNSKKIDKPPYFSITTLPIYSLHDEIQTIESLKVSITAPHGTGKTILIPLFLACRLIHNQSSSKFVILIEHDISSIHNIKNIYKRMCYRDKDDDFNEYDDDNDTLIITSSLSRIVKYYEIFCKPKSSLYFPVVGILSPIDALHLIHSVKDINHLVSNSIFIIDDVHLRTVETDVFVQDISNQLNHRKKSYLPRLIMMSTIQDDNYIKLNGHHQQLTLQSEEEIEASIEKVKSESISKITDEDFFKKMKNFFNNWLKSDGTTCLGSVVVFVPSEKVGQRIFKKIFNYYKDANATNVCPLKTTIRKGEDVHNFYTRLLDEMTLAEEERPEVNVLFLMPMLLSENISNEERTLIHSQLPLPFVDKLSRVFITTIKNEQHLLIQDLSVIFDSGIQEVEFFDPNQSTIHVREQLLPKPFIEQHFNMISANINGKYFKFDVEGIKRPNSLIPYVKRSDLSRQLLVLRSFGIKLEKQKNLPNEPKRELRESCFSLLQKIGVIDNTKENELTPLGKEAAKYSFVSPFFAVATAKFNERPQFAFLCSLIIENSRYLVTDPKSKLLCKHFERDSDVVTLLESICEICEGVEAGLEDTGISIGILSMIYSQMESTFIGCKGRSAIIDSVKWARTQPGGTIGMVDKFVSLLDQNEFLNKRKGEFDHVRDAGPGREPLVVYKANEIFKFTNKEEESKKDSFSNIKIARRPGWLGLQSPGNIYFLSVIVEEKDNLNRGLIIHRNCLEDSNNPGIISSNVENPALNSFFFVSLFESYWSGHSTVNDFVGIYHTSYQSKESAFLIHMTEDDGKTFINYCPRNKETEKAMSEAIPILSGLLPFVPRSIIAKVDIPLCAVEINGHGTSNHYVSRVLLINEVDSDAPFAYPINKVTIEYANKYIHELRKDIPQIRFAITGECFYYKQIDGNENEADLTYPDVTPSLKSVFDSHHSSHMVLLVNKDYPNKPPIEPLAWLSDGKDAPKEGKENDSKDNEMIVSVTSKIMDGIGYAEHSNDIFFVSLGGGFPMVGEGSVPETIYDKIGYDKGEIKRGIYPLVKHFHKAFIKKQNIDKEIPLKQLSSTNAWKGYPTNEVQRENLCKEVSKAIINHFGLAKESDAITSFQGPSLLAISIENLPKDYVTHLKNEDVWEDTYQPCKADNEITNILNNEIKTVDFQVTKIVHEPVIKICVYHMRRMNMNEEEFVEKIKSINNMFGFLCVFDIDYIYANHEQEKIGILGLVNIEFIGLATGLAFASVVTKEFQLKLESDFDISCTMRTCRGMAAIDPRLIPPDEKEGTKLVKVTPEEAETFKELIAMKNAGMKDEKWNLDTNFNILIIPETEEAAVKEMVRKVRNKDEDTTCLIICDPPQTFLPQTLYLYHKDGSVKSIAICKQCMIESFREMKQLQDIIDPLTHVINRTKLASINQQFPCIPLCADGTNDGTESWPQIPIGQAYWALMSDPDIIGPFLKSWITATIDFTIRKAAFYFTFCPNHPDIPYRTPKKNTSIMCPYCDMLYCSNCKDWHPLGMVCTADDEGFKRCPNCNVKSFKYDGCNSIYCPECGKYWCYKCEKSPIFETDVESHAHLTAAHGGYWT